mmetsp:Transcript_11287/g.27756  ORF Transcript_11287/g.27756 Transcript_11287/m.27756 type:complete len:239 (-) Transcript_11287:699-1415(-)
MFHQEQIRMNHTALPQNVNARALEALCAALDALQCDVLEHARLDDTKDLGQYVEHAPHGGKPRFVHAKLGGDGVVPQRLPVVRFCGGRRPCGLLGIIISRPLLPSSVVVLDDDGHPRLLPQKLPRIIQILRARLEPRDLPVERPIRAEYQSLLRVPDDGRAGPGRREGRGRRVRRGSLLPQHGHDLAEHVEVEDGHESPSDGAVQGRAEGGEGGLELRVAVRGVLREDLGCEGRRGGV